MTMGAGDAGCAAETGAVFVGGDAGRAGVGDAGRCTLDCGVATDDLRVVGRRLVCAIDVDEKTKSSITGTRLAGVFEDFIREFACRFFDGY